MRARCSVKTKAGQFTVVDFCFVDLLLLFSCLLVGRASVLFFSIDTCRSRTTHSRRSTTYRLAITTDQRSGKKKAPYHATSSASLLAAENR